VSAQENKALAHRAYVEVFQQGQPEAADELFAPEYVWHTPAMPEPIHGSEGVQRFAAMMRVGFPDYQLTEEDSIAEGDKVACRWTLRGTHLGPFLGIPGTGREITIAGIDIWRVADDRLVETWQGWDQLNMLQQMGAML
jgi:steroid delta-isomerase-like uncharacterized protein